MRYLLAALMQSVVIGTIFAYGADGEDEEKRHKVFVRGIKIGLVLFPISMSVGSIISGDEHAVSRDRR